VRSQRRTDSSREEVTAIPYGSEKSSEVMGARCPSRVYRSTLSAEYRGSTRKGLAMNATPLGRSSCSDGRKAGPFLLRRLAETVLPCFLSSCSADRSWSPCTGVVGDQYGVRKRNRIGRTLIFQLEFLLSQSEQSSKETIAYVLEL
jgi:hypothetical protein